VEDIYYDDCDDDELHDSAAAAAVTASVCVYVCVSVCVCKAYVIVVLLLAFEALVKYHQMQCRPLLSGVRPPRGVIFPQITRADADDSLVGCLKYFANYGFYRFGREVRHSFSTFSCNTSHRFDIALTVLGISTQLLDI